MGDLLLSPHLVAVRELVPQPPLFCPNHLVQRWERLPEQRHQKSLHAPYCQATYSRTIPPSLVLVSALVLVSVSVVMVFLVFLVLPVLVVLLVLGSRREIYTDCDFYQAFQGQGGPRQR